MKCLVVLILVLLAPIQVFGSEKCLEFKRGLEFNKSKEFFLQKYKAFRSVVDEIDIYSASYDLNSDGKPEYFYYIEHYKFCGNRTGCYIYVYKRDNGKFIKLMRDWPTFNKFEPERNPQTKYLCIASDPAAKWKDLIFEGDKVFSCNGQQYSQ